MLFPCRCIGSIAHLRDLHVLASSGSGHLDRLQVNQSSYLETYVTQLFHVDWESLIFKTQQQYPEMHHWSLPGFHHPQSAVIIGCSAYHSFHTSPHVPYDSISYNVTDMPDFFVKYEQYHATPSINSVSPVLSVFPKSCLTNRVHHRYTPGYRRQTHTHTRDGSVPALRVRVWSWVPSLVPIPVPAVGIPVGYEQGGRAKVRATQAMAQRA